MKSASYRVMRCLVALGALISSSDFAFATAYQGYVSNVFALGGGVMITIKGGFYDGATATCGGDANGVSYMADPATAYGRTIISIALSAKLSGRLVWAGANGVCVSGYESINALDLKG